MRELWKSLRGIGAHSLVWKLATGFFALACIGILLQRALNWPSWSTLDSVGSFGGFIVAVIAVGLAVVGHLQSQEMHRQEFRAWLGIDSKDGDAITIAVGETYYFSVQNYGRTPAKFVTAMGDCKISPMFWNGDGWSTADPTSRSGLTVHPGAETRMGIMLHAITTEDIKLIKSGEKALYFTITVKYEDIFGAQRITRQGFVLTEHSLRARGFEVWDFQTEVT